MADARPKPRRVLRRLIRATAPRLSLRARRNRFGIFLSFISPVARPLRILDVGGTQVFWESMGFTEAAGIDVVILNVFPVGATHANFTSMVGDATAMPQFRDGEFDVVFSNSVIEHVGGWDDQRRMAHEIRRVGRRYFVQTPNRKFPIEPHFLFPFFQFLPLSLRAWLLSRLALGWGPTGHRYPDREEAVRVASSVRLLSLRELRVLFPGALIHRERLLRLAKSFIACGESIPPRPTDAAQSVRGGPSGSTGRS